MDNFKIDPEFAQMLPPLSEDERNTLLLLIQRDGCHPGLVVVLPDGQRILMDGHHRRDICKELGIPFPTTDIQKPDRKAIRLHIIQLQNGRRNLTDEWQRYFMGEQMLLQKKATIRAPDGRFFQPVDRETQRVQDALASRQETPWDQSDPTVDRTADKIAAEHGVSSATVKRNAQFAEAVDRLAEEKGPEFKQDILSGQSGLSREEIIKAATLCDRCKFLNVAVKGCQACDLLRNPPRRHSIPSPDTTKITSAFDWSEWERKYQDLSRACDEIAAAFPGVRETPMYQGGKRLFTEIQTHMSAWKKQLTTKEK